MEVRLPHELMLFVALAGVVLLTVAWILARWARGGPHADPGARLLAAVSLGALGWLVAAGPWTWVGASWGVWFWTPYVLALALFLVDWARPGRGRRP